MNSLKDFRFKTILHLTAYGPETWTIIDSNEERWGKVL